VLAQRLKLRKKSRNSTAFEEQHELGRRPIIGINLKSYENILCVTKGGHDCVTCRVYLVVATASEIVVSYAEGGALHFLDLAVSS
jgi:hypothetical protein